MSESKANKQTNSVHARRILAYIVLAILAFLCLIWLSNHPNPMPPFLSR